MGRIVGAHCGSLHADRESLVGPAIVTPGRFRYLRVAPGCFKYNTKPSRPRYRLYRKRMIPCIPLCGVARSMYPGTANLHSQRREAKPNPRPCTGLENSSRYYAFVLPQSAPPILLLSKPLNSLPLIVPLLFLCLFRPTLER